MAYVKLFYGVTDFSAGYQTINQLYENYQYLRDSLANEHSALEPAPGPNGQVTMPPLAQSFGHHATPKIPRAVVKSDVQTTSYNVVTAGMLTVRPVVTGVARMAAGVYFIGISGLREYYAEVEAVQTDSASEYLINARTGLGGNGTPPGIVIESYFNDAGVFTLTDINWSAVIYGTHE